MGSTPTSETMEIKREVYLPPPIPWDDNETVWRAQAACKDVDTDVFFPGKSSGYKRALKICNSCPVKTECAEFALQFDERVLPGMWGGLMGQERRRIRQERARSGHHFLQDQ